MWLVPDSTQKLALMHLGCRPTGLFCPFYLCANFIVFHERQLCQSFADFFPPLFVSGFFRQRLLCSRHRSHFSSACIRSSLSFSLLFFFPAHTQRFCPNRIYRPALSAAASPFLAFPKADTSAKNNKPRWNLACTKTRILEGCNSEREQEKEISSPLFKR